MEFCAGSESSVLCSLGALLTDLSPLSGKLAVDLDYL